jgi:hypothetical protein
LEIRKANKANKETLGRLLVGRIWRASSTVPVLDFEATKQFDVTGTEFV